MKEKKEEGFTVRDRRTASRESGQETHEKPPKQQDDSAQQNTADASQKTEEQKETGHLPGLEFSSFILSLATTAQVSLGLVPNPETDLTAQNLPAAKQMIDILAMLREKTKGNLTEQEQALFDNALYSLRMQYITISGGKK